MPKKKNETPPQKVHQKKTQLLELTDGFCQKYLDKRYKKLCQKLIEELSRKRPVPFLSGRLEIWAASIIQALGQVNFLFDKSVEPYVSVATLNQHFGTTQSSVMNKARKIRQMLESDYFQHFDGNELLETHPLNQLVAVNGVLVPVKELPPELQYLVQQMGITELETIDFGQPS
jgi:hypothetical protein